MNERIRQLAEQAGFITTPNTDVIKNNHRGGYMDGRQFEKFAELIVRECVNYINERTLDWDAELRWIFNDGSGDMAVDVDDLLNRHFGVEE